MMHDKYTNSNPFKVSIRNRNETSNTKSISTTSSPAVVKNAPDDSVLSEIRHLLRSGFIDKKTCAELITGKIRYAFVNGLNTNGDKLDIESLKYIDSILFDNVKYIIGSSLIYGYDNYIHKILSNMIAEAMSVIDYVLTPEATEYIDGILTDIKKI